MKMKMYMKDNLEKERKMEKEYFNTLNQVNEKINY